MQHRVTPRKPNHCMHLSRSASGHQSFNFEILLPQNHTNINTEQGWCDKETIFLLSGVTIIILSPELTYVRSNSLKVEFTFNASPMASAPSLPKPFHARFKVFRVIFSYNNNIQCTCWCYLPYPYLLAFLFRFLQDGLLGRQCVLCLRAYTLVIFVAMCQASLQGTLLHGQIFGSKKQIFKKAARQVAQ